MKLLPYFLLNVATIVVALVVYESLRSDEALSTSLVGGGVDRVEIDRRLAALERAQQPLLRTEGVPPALQQQLEDLDVRLKTLARARSEVSASGAQAEAEPAPAALASLPGPETEPTPQAVAAFRRLQEAVRQEDRRVRERQRLDTLLAKQDIALSAEQRERVAAIYTAFEERRNRVWTEAKAQVSTAGAAVDWKSILRDTNAQLERELGERLARVLPTDEAEAVARALSPR